MPVYNCEAFVSDQLDSLLNQTFGDFELIVVNDGSSDLTSSIVKDYSALDPRIKLIDNEFHKGIAGALNTGLKYAIGKYIARADGDDIHLPDRLRIQYDFLENHQEIDVVGARAKLFNNQGPIRESAYPRRSIELCWKFISNTYFCHPSVMFRASLYTKFGGYPNVTVEDFAYFSKIIKTRRGYNLPISLLNYRVHDQSYSTANLQLINKYVLDMFRENYAYYIPSLALSNEFHLFQVSGLLSPKYFFKILNINILILNKIRVDYHMKMYNWEFLVVLTTHCARMVDSMFKFLRMNFSAYLRRKFNFSS